MPKTSSAHRLGDLKTEVYHQTNLPASSQLLLLPEGGLLEEGALSRSAAATEELPPTSLDSPYLLLDAGCPRVQAGGTHVAGHLFKAELYTATLWRW